eukprot:3265693-Prymnesium_polylepis.1
MSLAITSLTRALRNPMRSFATEGGASRFFHGVHRAPGRWGDTLRRVRALRTTGGTLTRDARTAFF